jgi:hypothetical protein
VQSRCCSPSAVWGPIGEKDSRICPWGVQNTWKRPRFDAAEDTAQRNGSHLSGARSQGIHASLMIAKTPFADDDLHAMYTRLGLFVEIMNSRRCYDDGRVPSVSGKGPVLGAALSLGRQSADSSVSRCLWFCECVLSQLPNRLDDAMDLLFSQKTIMTAARTRNLTAKRCVASLESYSPSSRSPLSFERGLRVKSNSSNPPADDLAQGWLV